MKQNKDLDQILQHALSPEEEPDYWLNQKILNKAKEIGKMDKKQKRRIPAAAMVAALALSVGSVTAFAAWQYMTPDKVAEVMEDKGLMKAFKSEDAIIINESQMNGDFKITLLGMVSGKNLSQYMTEELDADKTYVVTAIENADGTPIDMDNGGYNLVDLVVSPFVKGLEPWQYNVYTMNGGCTAKTEDGIEYRITECDNIEMFADRGLYISVTDGAPSADAYQYDEKTGEITRKESYKGVNALFNLPIDKSKADPEAAEQYLKEMNDNEEEYTIDDSDSDGVMDKVSKWDAKKVEKNAELLEDLTQVLTPDEDGMVTTDSYEIGDVQSGNEQFSAKEYFRGKKAGETIVESVFSGGTEKEAYIETITLNEDGTITKKVYHYSE